MLGLDTGWNCHISLSNKVHSGGNTTNQFKTTADSVISDYNEKSSNYLDTTSPERVKILLAKCGKSTRKHKFLNKFSHRNPRFLSKRMQPQTSTSPNKTLSNLSGSKKYSSKSLPSLKFNKFGLNQDSTTQIVKFNLTNLKYSLKKYKKLAHGEGSNARSTYFKKKKLVKLNSIERSSISSSSFDENNTDDESLTQSKRLKAKKTQQYRMSESSLKSNSISKSILKLISNDKRRSLSSQRKPNNLEQIDDDDSSSCQTNHSGRTLSETEILGNAVKKFTNLKIKSKQ